ncbi:MAG: GNAT family N-acetyltransferase [Pseudomonadota bacterium]
MGDTFVIRASTQADLHRVDALLARSYPALLKSAYPASVLVTAIPLISKAQPHLLASGTYFVVTDGEEIVGAGGWTRASPRARGHAKNAGAHIRHVVTDHRLVRAGIGRRLMHHIFATARQAGVTRLECLSTLMAEPFYQAVGFETVAPVTLNLRAGIDFPVVQMRHDL